MLRRRNLTGWTTLAMVAAWPMSLAGADLESPPPRTVVAELEVQPARIDWRPQVDYELLVLTVAGPGDLYIRRAFAPGEAPQLSLFDSAGNRLPDGIYAYELRPVPRQDREVSGRLGPARQGGDDAVVEKLKSERALPERPLVQSGSLSVWEGRFVDTGSGSDEAFGPAKSASEPAPPRVGTKLITAENECIGSLCESGDDNNLVLKLKDEQVSILFEVVIDNPVHPDRDWRLQANDVFNDRFLFRDVDAQTVPFSIEGDAPDNSLYVNTNGNIGIGTSTPAVPLDVRASTGGAAGGRVQNSSSTGYSGFEYTNSSGTVISFLGTDNAAGNTRFNSTNSYPIVLLTNSVEHFRVESDGDIGINCNAAGSDLVIASGSGCSNPSSSINAGSAQFTTASSRTFKENLSRLEVPDILDKIAGIGVFNYDFINGPKDRIGLMAEDFHQVFGRGSDKYLNGDEVQVALWLAVQQLTARSQELAQANQDLRQQIEELKRSH